MVIFLVRVKSDGDNVDTGKDDGSFILVGNNGYSNIAKKEIDVKSTVLL